MLRGVYGCKKNMLKHQKSSIKIKYLFGYSSNYWLFVVYCQLYLCSDFAHAHMVGDAYAFGIGAAAPMSMHIIPLIRIT